MRFCTFADDSIPRPEDTNTSSTSSLQEKASEHLATNLDSSKPPSMQALSQSDDNFRVRSVQPPMSEMSMADSFRSPNESQYADAKTVSPLLIQMPDAELVNMVDSGALFRELAGLGTGLYTGHDENFIRVAQIMADQLTVYSMIKTSDRPFTSIEATPSFKYTQYDDPLGSIVPALFPQSEICTLESWASTGETHRGVIAPAKALIRPMQRRVDSFRGSADQTPSSASIFKLDPPNMRVLRGDALMELSATGLQFWEELGLSPCLGPKNITGYCVYPQTEMIHRGVTSFMDLMSMTYQSLRLGSHRWGHEVMNEFSRGFVSVPVITDSMIVSPVSIAIACERLGTLLHWKDKNSSSDRHRGDVLGDPTLSDQTVIVYMVIPYTNLALLPRLCESFLECLKKYEADVETADRSDLVLKLLPLEWVASRRAIPLPSPKEYAALAKDVYDRCPAKPSSRNPSPFTSTSLVQLAETIPNTLDFRLAANPISSLARNNSALHVGYSWPRKSQWLCVSVADNLGSLQWNASYCFGTAISNPWPTFREISREIWRGILDMIDEPQAKRYIYIIKDELLAQEEIDGIPHSVCSVTRTNV